MWQVGKISVDTAHMADFTHSRAIIIGIDAYANGIPRLTTAVNDAARLAELLRAEHGYRAIPTQILALWR